MHINVYMDIYTIMNKYIYILFMLMYRHVCIFTYTCVCICIGYCEFGWIKNGPQCRPRRAKNRGSPNKSRYYGPRYVYCTYFVVLSVNLH
jgi:hypothetical protein